jgi:predicted GIY-YIG superfamily endonuclease
MKGYTYILECVDGSFYVGSTSDLIMRFNQHQSGEGSNYTKEHLPVKLIYYELYETVKEAFQRKNKFKVGPEQKRLH